MLCPIQKDANYIAAASPVVAAIEHDSTLASGRLSATWRFLDSFDANAGAGF
jgi:hypothetical protein